MNASLFQNAMALSIIAHRGEWRLSKKCESYICHPIRVAAQFSDDEEIEKCIALLHDAVENQKTTMKKNLILQKIKTEFPEDIYRGVEILTKRKDEEYIDYIFRVAKNKMTRKIKEADILDNIDTATPKKQQEYSAVLAFLQSF